MGLWENWKKKKKFNSFSYADFHQVSSGPSWLTTRAVLMTLGTRRMSIRPAQMFLPEYFPSASQDFCSSGKYGLLILHTHPHTHIHTHTQGKWQWQNSRTQSTTCGLKTPQRSTVTKRSRAVNRKSVWQYNSHCNRSSVSQASS